MDNETKKEVSSYDIDDITTVQVADDVIAVIAGLAATDVDGVARLSGNITNEIVSKLGRKNLSKGVKVALAGHDASVKLNLIIEYGVSIPKTCKEVQERVKSAISTMTGLNVTSVDIRIAGIQSN